MATPAPASLRQHHIEALARRAARHQGAVRQLLDERLRALQAQSVAVPAAAAPGTPATATASTPASTPASAPASALSALLAHIARHDHAAGEATPGPRAAAAAGGPGVVPAPRELKAVRDYRSTWSRLSVEQRVNQALARVPVNAGPLNTQRLVHQALKLLRDISPAYMHRLVTQVEALLWLEAVGQGDRPGAGAASGAGRKRPERAEKAAGGATGSGRS